MKHSFTLIKNDIKNYYKGILLAILCLILLKVLFGQICPGKIFCGIPCPACGMTRAFCLLLQGHLKASIQMHPLLLPFLFCCIYFIFIKYFLKKTLQNINIYIIIGLSLFILVYICRFITYFPKTEPMTYYKKNLLHFVFILWNKWKH